MFERCSFSLMSALYESCLLNVPQSAWLHLCSNYKSLGYSTNGPKNCAIQYCSVLCWCGMTWLNWKSWFFFSGQSSCSTVHIFIYFVYNFRFEPVFGWIHYAGNQFLLHVKEVHDTSWALCNYLPYIPPITFVMFLKIYINLTIDVQRTDSCYHVQYFVMFVVSILADKFHLPFIDQLK